ncbi:hypothetical protein RyT2_12330 [Pseudolactococcus yaeyamensis]
MKKKKSILKSRALFYGLLMIGLGVKVIDVFLVAKNVFYLPHILQGFVLTILMPALLTALIIGFASFIGRKWLCYSITLVFALLGSGVLFLGTLYYRLEKHFIFFIDDIPTVSNVDTSQGTLFGQVQISDIVFVSDFIVIFFVLLIAAIFNKEKKAKPQPTGLLTDYKELVSSLRVSLDQMENNLAMQDSRMGQLKNKNEQLKDTKTELVLKKFQLQEKYDKSQPDAKKEVAYAKTENINVLGEMNRLQALKSQLEEARAQKELVLKAAKEYKLAQEEKSNQLINASASKNVEKRYLDEQDKIQKMKKIAQETYEEMLSRTDAS